MDDRRHFNNFDCIFDTLAMLEYAASLVALGGGAAKEAGDDVEGAVVEDQDLELKLRFQAWKEK